MANDNVIRKPWCTGDKVGDTCILGGNHTYSKWKIVRIDVEPDGYRVACLARIPWDNA